MKAWPCSQSIFLNDTKIIDLKPLSALKKLTYLALSDTSVSDLVPLKNLTRLKQLELNPWESLHEKFPVGCLVEGGTFVCRRR